MTRFAVLALVAFAACLASATAFARPYHHYEHRHYHPHHVVVIRR